MELSWYYRRLRLASPGELAGRAGDFARQQFWRRRQVRPGQVPPSPVTTGPRRFANPLPLAVAAAVPGPARAALLAHADDLLKGRGETLGVERDDLADPDWFLDPVTGKRARASQYAFRIQYRSEGQVGNVKQLWELSRHHHLTVLAAAWFLSGDERYPELAAAQLRSWWRQNPFLSGVNWTSGIELGLRLVSWAWIRRLLGGWAGAGPLFEENGDAARQVYWHQRYLAAFRTRGSSANNHVIAEAAGQLVASCAFPWFPDSDQWRRDAAASLEREVDRNTFPSGFNRELASGYHAFVAELGMLAAVEAAAAGHPLSDATWARLCKMVDVGAAVVDETLRPPRQGDDDDGRSLVLDAPGAGDWASFLALGGSLFGPLPWWPATEPNVRSTVVAALAGEPRPTAGRPRRRPSHFADAGMTILRTRQSGGSEIWCRCDGGPHGFLSIAAHAHADALSIEVRCGGVDVLADPGTYCYHGESEWRTYFRSTIGHNTLELAGRDQSEAGGPFLWVRQASTTPLGVLIDEDADACSWSAEHDGYTILEPPAVHRRTVSLDRYRRRLEVVDQVRTAGSPVYRLAFHLGPSVRAELAGSRAVLHWPTGSGDTGTATMTLPDCLSWTAHVGQAAPILGWYSPRFGAKEPTITLVGRGVWGSPHGDLATIVDFAESPDSGASCG